MKAPRKTVKRPLYRYIQTEMKDDDNEKIEKNETKEKNEIVTKSPEKNNETFDILASPVIEFNNKEAEISPVDVFNDDIPEFIESFNDLTADDNTTGFDFLIPFDFDVII